ncbi:MAG: ankyrin repeat domain-containing protein [Bacilli bacterium]|nr:ankyrin repeat domain-containing protein [Bacilli bacterium]
MNYDKNGLEKLEKLKQKLYESFQFDKYDKEKATIKEPTSDEEIEAREKYSIELLDMFIHANDKEYSDESRLKKCKELLLKGADPNFKGLPNNRNKREEKGNFPLLLCSRKGYTKIAHLLLCFGADPNMANNYGTTSVMAAARHGHSEILEMLIAKGADINAVCRDGDYALISAVYHNEKEKKQDKCIDILLLNQAYVNMHNYAGETPFTKTKRKEDIAKLNNNYIEGNFNYESDYYTTSDDWKEAIRDAEEKLRLVKEKM